MKNSIAYLPKDKQEELDFLIKEVLISCFIKHAKTTTMLSD